MYIAHSSPLNLSTPEVNLLDAVGYNFGAAIATPEPSTVLLVMAGLGVLPLLRKQRS